MREIIVAGVSFFHTARIFDDLGNFYVKNDAVIPAASAFNMVAVQIGMPMLFVIAGFSIWSSLQKRRPFEFILERLRRLIVPFIVGISTIVPPQKYFQSLRSATHYESYGHFYLRFFDVSFTWDFPWFLTGSAGSRLFDRGNSWFLYDLFVFTILLLPFFLYLQSRHGQRLAGRIADICSIPYAIFLFAIPIALIEAVFKTDFAGGWGKAAYIPFIVCGYMLGVDDRFGKALYKHRKISAALGMMTFAVGSVLYNMLSKNSNIDPLTSYDSASVFFRTVKGINGWLLSVSLLGFLESIRLKNPSKNHFGNTVEQYANRAVLPFYLLHETVVVITGFHVIQWHMDAFLKFLIIGLSSFAFTLLIYDCLIRRFKLMRLLFGMKPDIG